VSEAVSLETLGYGPRWQALFAPFAAEGLAPARVLRASRGSVVLATAAGVERAKPSVRLRKATAELAELPTVGDWVAVCSRDDFDVALIEGVLTRASAIVRGDPAGGSKTQALAANVDTVFVVHPIDEAPNLRRIERELALAWSSGAVPVVVLTKADLSAHVAEARGAVESVAPGVDVLVTSALGGEGVDLLLPYISDHRTAVLIGPSGVGKSTLVNALLGEERQATREVRVNDRRGRHTTVTRELILLPSGGILIDTPGLRAIGMVGANEGVASAFPEISELAEACRFRDCTHCDEPGCAVRAAVESGALPGERLASYHKLQREAEVAAAKTDARLRAVEAQKKKAINKAVKIYYRDHKGR